MTFLANGQGKQEFYDRFLTLLGVCAVVGNHFADLARWKVGRIQAVSPLAANMALPALISRLAVKWLGQRTRPQKIKAKIF